MIVTRGIINPMQEGKMNGNEEVPIGYSNRDKLRDQADRLEKLEADLSNVRERLDEMEKKLTHYPPPIDPGFMPGHTW